MLYEVITPRGKHLPALPETGGSARVQPEGAGDGTTLPDRNPGIAGPGRPPGDRRPRELIPPADTGILFRFPIV